MSLPTRGATGLLALLFAAPTIASTPLTTLNAVNHALSHGATVTAVVDLRTCTPAAGTAQPGTAVGGLKIGAFRVLPDGTLSFADDHFTIDRDGLPVMQYLRYRATPDQQVAFTMDVFSLPSYAKKIPELGYNCRLGQGVSFFDASER